MSQVQLNDPETLKFAKAAMNFEEYYSIEDYGKLLMIQTCLKDTGPVNFVLNSKLNLNKNEQITNSTIRANFFVEGKERELLFEKSMLIKIYAICKIYSENNKFIKILIHRAEQYDANEILKKINELRIFKGALKLYLDIDEYPIKTYFLEENKFFNKDNNVNNIDIEKEFYLKKIPNSQNNVNQNNNLNNSLQTQRYLDNNNNNIQDNNYNNINQQNSIYNNINTYIYQSNNQYLMNKDSILIQQLLLKNKYFFQYICNYIFQNNNNPINSFLEPKINELNIIQNNITLTNLNNIYSMKENLCNCLNIIEKKNMILINRINMIQMNNNNLIQMNNNNLNQMKNSMKLTNNNNMNQMNKNSMRQVNNNNMNQLNNNNMNQLNNNNIQMNQINNNMNQFNNNIQMNMINNNNISQFNNNNVNQFNTNNQMSQNNNNMSQFNSNNQMNQNNNIQVNTNNQINQINNNNMNQFNANNQINQNNNIQVNQFNTNNQINQNNNNMNQFNANNQINQNNNIQINQFNNNNQMNSNNQMNQNNNINQMNQSMNQFINNQVNQINNINQMNQNNNQVNQINNNQMNQIYNNMNQINNINQMFNYMQPIIFNLKEILKNIDSIINLSQNNFKRNNNFENKGNSTIINKNNNGKENKENYNEEDNTLFRAYEEYFPLVGLRNVGLTCYMNSILQCLLHIPQLNAFFINIYQDQKNKFKEINKEAETHGRLCEEYHKIVMKIYNNQNYKNNYISPKDFNDVLSHINTQFAQFEANDAKDLLLYLFQSMHAELNYLGDKKLKNVPRCNQTIEAESFNFFMTVNNNLNLSIISYLFYGIHKSTTICSECNTTLYNFQYFQFLSFPTFNFKGEIFNIYQGFKEFIKPEIMSGDNKCYCQRCKGLKNAKVTTKIYSAPIYLIINIDYGKNKRYKPKKINFGGLIDITGFIDESNKCPNIQYKLIAVSTHIGKSGSSGHYITFCQNNENKWYEFNDSSVTETKFEYVNSNSPYILIYKKNK